jgi:hypothetical protein
MNGNVPVKFVSKIPMCLSAKVAKQKMLVSESLSDLITAARVLGRSKQVGVCAVKGNQVDVVVFGRLDWRDTEECVGCRGCRDVAHT